MGARGAQGLFAALAWSLAVSRAHAQHCEPPLAPEASPLRATVRAEAARYESGSEQGYYEGVALGLAFEYEPLRVRANMPYYRLLGPAKHADGPGDLESKVEFTVVEERPWAFGAALAASFPTGSADDRLGMGHVMLGPSVWLSRAGENVFASAELGYMGALADAEDSEPIAAHQHHQSPTTNVHHAAGGPIPNPMNANEAWLGLAASYEAAPPLGLSAGGTLAVPTTEDGETRATLRASVGFALGRLSTGIGVEVDVLGVTQRLLGHTNASVSF
jgi:hypothetical protein